MNKDFKSRIVEFEKLYNFIPKPIIRNAYSVIYFKKSGSNKLMAEWSRSFGDNLYIEYFTYDVYCHRGIDVSLYHSVSLLDNNLKYDFSEHQRPSKFTLSRKEHKEQCERNHFTR